MSQYMNDDAIFERLESLRQEVESSRLMAQGLRGWGRLLRDLLGGLAMRRPPRRRSLPTHHAFEDATTTDAA